MDPIPAAHEKSLRRSRVRLHVLLALSSLGEAYVGQISRLRGIPWGRVKACLLGKPPGYRVELSLVGLGLVKERRSRAGTMFVITTAGRRKARSVTKAWARRRSARDRAVHHAQVLGHLAAGDEADERSPEP